MRAQKAIERNCPNSFLWLYYTFCSEFNFRPTDIDEMLDGLCCIRAKSEVEEILNGE